MSFLGVGWGGGLTLIVLKCKPELPKDEVQRIVDDVNDTRNFTRMLKEMRTLFVNAAKNE